jgi:hypothetical protein
MGETLKEGEKGHNEGRRLKYNILRASRINLINQSAFPYVAK